MTQRIQALEELRQQAPNFDMKVEQLYAAANALPLSFLATKANEKTQKAEKDVNVYKTELEARYVEKEEMKKGHQEVEETLKNLNVWLDEVEADAEKLKQKPLDANVELISSVIDEFKVRIVIFFSD